MRKQHVTISNECVNFFLVLRKINIFNESNEKYQCSSFEEAKLKMSNDPILNFVTNGLRTRRRLFVGSREPSQFYLLEGFFFG